MNYTLLLGKAAITPRREYRGQLFVTIAKLRRLRWPSPAERPWRSAPSPGTGEERRAFSRLRPLERVEPRLGGFLAGGAGFGVEAVDEVVEEKIGLAARLGRVHAASSARA